MAVPRFPMESPPANGPRWDFGPFQPVSEYTLYIGPLSGARRQQKHRPENGSGWDHVGRAPQTSLRPIASQPAAHTIPSRNRTDSAIRNPTRRSALPKAGSSVSAKPLWIFRNTSKRGVVSNPKTVRMWQRTTWDNTPKIRPTRALPIKHLCFPHIFKATLFRQRMPRPVSMLAKTTSRGSTN